MSRHAKIFDLKEMCVYIAYQKTKNEYILHITCLHANIFYKNENGAYILLNLLNPKRKINLNTAFMFMHIFEYTTRSSRDFSPRNTRFPFQFRFNNYTLCVP